LVALSLAEGETIRRIIHSKHIITTRASIALRSVDGRVIDSTSNFVESVPRVEVLTSLSSSKQKTVPIGLVEMGVQCFRFFNCEMYYSDKELSVLEFALKGSSLDNRLNFFLESLRLRRRERNLWGDTPLAKLFLPQEEWHLLRTKAVLEQIIEALKKVINERNRRSI